MASQNGSMAGSYCGLKHAFNPIPLTLFKQVGVTSQQEIERVVREQSLRGKGKLKVKMILTAEDAGLTHVVEGEIELS
jgi:hypothetical protein